MALSHRTEGAGQGILQPVQRQIVLPAPGQFKDMESFQMTALHEIATPPGIPHDSTAPACTHKERADMPGSGSSPSAQLPSQAGTIGNSSYSRERENAQYLKSWLANLKEDPGYLMSV